MELKVKNISYELKMRIVLVSCFLNVKINNILLFQD